MVEPVSLSLGAIVAALVTKTAAEAAEKAVEGGAAVVGRVVRWLRERFATDKDEAGAAALARAEDAPDQTRIKELAEMLNRRAEADGDFRAGLEALVADTGSAGVDVGSISQKVYGNQNVIIVDVKDSNVNVTYGGQASPPPGT
jgi:hypothetical protein